MPLAREIEYWDGVAAKLVNEDRVIRDNVWKRPEEIKRLLKYNWLGENVLEIGVGNGMIAGALQLILQGHWDYIGTELSPNFRKTSQAMFQLEVVSADVLELPVGEYTRIIALDSLEHVRPEHRVEGYAKIASVAAKDALLFIHFSRSTSYHDKEFDHPFGLADIAALEAVSFTLNKYERYTCVLPEENLDYVFVVMQKC